MNSREQFWATEFSRAASDYYSDGWTGGNTLVGSAASWADLALVEFDKRFTPPSVGELINIIEEVSTRLAKGPLNG